MQPYWITVEQVPTPSIFKTGVGVTAYSELDARNLFAANIGDEYAIQAVERIADINQLDAGHVLPNMGNWMRRGIWFPLGFDQK
jgi:hypothetical protein